MMFHASLLLVLGCMAATSHSEKCTKITNRFGSIEDYLNAKEEENCWIIQVPKKHIITLEIKSVRFEASVYNGLEITELRTGHSYDIYYQRELSLASDIKITHYARANRYGTEYRYSSQFSLTFEIKKGFIPIEGIMYTKRRAVSWLKEQRSVSSGWKANTPRAVVALYLASAVNFNGSVYEEELMSNQVELKTLASLLKHSNTDNELSMLLNALVVTCHNPRKFHGINVVQRLKKQVEWNENFTHPITYLALCNAKETWPMKAIGDLESILKSTVELPAITDMKAMAVMALSCFLNHNESNDFSNRSRVIDLYEYNIEHFKTLQLEDGSFGNVYTTALIAQALISEGAQDWRLNSTSEYLAQKLNNSINFLTTYFALPVFSGKSLVDISDRNCSSHRKHGDDILDEVRKDIGPRIQVKYSLYIGSKKDVVHSITLKVPHGFTALQIMELAEIQNSKYKFERKVLSGKVNVYEIADLPNDPEHMKYWLLYVSSSNGTESISFTTKSPNEMIMEDGQHLVMWYKNLHEA